MVTPRNDSIELSVVKEKYPAPSAPPPDEFVNGTAFEKSGSKRPRKRCWTVVTLVVVVLVAIGAGTILFYEHLLGWLPAESNGHGPLPEATEVVGTTSRVPDLVNPYPEEPRSSSSSTTTTEVIFIDSTTDGDPDEHIFIDSQEESVESSSAEDRTTSEEEGVSSGDGVTSGSYKDDSYEAASGDGSGEGSGEGRE